jgi:hypothetical protein
VSTPEIRVSVDEEAVARAAATIREAGRQLAETMGRFEAMAVEPWIIDTPNGRMAGYVDDQNQEHWLPTDWLLVEDVPVSSGLRKLYVQKRS